MEVGKCIEKWGKKTNGNQTFRLRKGGKKANELQ